MHNRQSMFATILLGSLLAVGNPFVVAADKEKVDGAPPSLGDSAPDFALKNLKGDEVKLSDLTKQGPVVLLVLRGYPGYQCPLCSIQVGDFIGKAKSFSSAGANVVMIYPGPADNLSEYAKEFMGKRSLPEGYELLVDPDFTFTNAYNLRWDAPQETAYPSTFLIDKEGTIRFTKISKSHGDRTQAKDVLDEAKKLTK
jgi:peroxiredoxin